MPEFVRVKDTKTHHEFTIDAINVVDGLKVIDKPAVDRIGRPLLPKPSISASKSADEKNGSDAANQEESK